jgi:hypothetical protein
VTAILAGAGIFFGAVRVAEDGWAIGILQAGSIRRVMNADLA